MVLDIANDFTICQILKSSKVETEVETINVTLFKIPIKLYLYDIKGKMILYIMKAAASRIYIIPYLHQNAFQICNEFETKSVDWILLALEQDQNFGWYRINQI